MSDPLSLRAELITAARLCGLADCGDKPLPPVLFHYITPDSGRRGHLSTTWAFSLCSFGNNVSAEEAAARIAARNPNWEAENGYINITLPPEQLAAAIEELAAAFDARNYTFVHPNDSDGHFLMEYFIYLAAQQAQCTQAEDQTAAEKKGTPCRNFTGRGSDPSAVIVYAALGGNCELLAREMYRWYRKNYGGEMSRPKELLYLKAAAGIFARQLYKKE